MHYLDSKCLIKLANSFSDLPFHHETEFLSVDILILWQDVEELIEEVQEARRIKLLHQPSKVQLCFLSNLLLQLRHMFYEEINIDKRDEKTKGHLSVIMKNISFIIYLKMCSRSKYSYVQPTISWIIQVTWWGTYK